MPPHNRGCQGKCLDTHSASQGVSGQGGRQCGIFVTPLKQKLAEVTSCSLLISFSFNEAYWFPVIKGKMLVPNIKKNVCVHTCMWTEARRECPCPAL